MRTLFMQMDSEQNIFSYCKGMIEFLQDDTLSASEKVKHFRRTLDSQPAANYPLYENNSAAILFYNRKAESVLLISDITGWTDPISFIKLDSDLFYLILELEPDARIQYLLNVDGKNIIDPLNKYISLHGLGEMSELVMPEFKRHPYFKEYLYGKEGSYENLIKHVLPSGSLPYEHELLIFLPEDYNQDEKYPVIYFHDGPDYIRFGLAPHSINLLIKENVIKPCIAVFITPPNLHQPFKPNRSTEYGMNDDYVRFVCEELVPFIDQNYSTKTSSESRIVIGDSYAGLISLYISLTRTDVFSKIYSQSGYFSFNNDRIIRMVTETDFKPIDFYFDIGTYEKIVGADFIPAQEIDFTDANRRMKNALLNKGYKFSYSEYHEGHTWGSWRQHLIDALIFFLGNKEISK